jgi:hypothetical protein
MSTTTKGGNWGWGTGQGREEGGGVGGLKRISSTHKNKSIIAREKKM